MPPIRAEYQFKDFCKKINLSFVCLANICEYCAKYFYNAHCRRYLWCNTNLRLFFISHFLKLHGLLIDNNSNILVFFNLNNNAISSHANFLENYDPTRALDPNAWMPKGILNDLIDINIESFPVKDEVNGFTNLEFFNTLSGTVSPQQWRNKLINIPPHHQQSSQIIKLFADYGF